MPAKTRPCRAGRRARWVRVALIISFQKWSGFGYFQAFARSRGEPSDALAWADLSSQEKRVFEAFSEVSGSNLSSRRLRSLADYLEQLERRGETNGKDRLVGCMEGEGSG